MKEYLVTTAVSQGTFTCPELFLLYINDLSHDVICNIAVSADDATFYCAYDQPSNLCHQLALASQLESDLSNTVDWTRKWLVDFDSEKIQLLEFYQSNNSGAIVVKMYGSSLEKKML